jgi:hypothetical protein
MQVQNTIDVESAGRPWALFLLVLRSTTKVWVQVQHGSNSMLQWFGTPERKPMASNIFIFKRTNRLYEIDYIQALPWIPNPIFASQM